MSRFKRLSWTVLGLRGRLSIGMLVMTFAACLAFALAIYEIVDVLQDQILEKTLTRELNSLSVGYRYGVPITEVWGGGGHVYISHAPNRDPGLPAILRHVHSGKHYTLRYQGHTYYVGRRDVERAAIYLMINIDDVESLKSRLVILGGATLAGTIVLALFIAFIFAWAILRPVSRLAERLSKYQPGQSNLSIAAEYEDHDVRDIAESFDDLIQRFDAAIAREKAFTEDASHELRTPLAVALNASELLSDMDNLDERARNRVARVRDACERMHRLVTALLFLARDQCGRPQDMSDAKVVLDDVLTYQRNAARAHCVEIMADARLTPLPLPEGVIYSVLHNLIENAIRHTENGLVKVKVAPGHIRVSDTGCGMTAETLAHVFERQYRTADSPGLGLGLYLVSRICDRQSWRIHVSSELDRGTCVEIQMFD